MGWKFGGHPLPSFTIPSHPLPSIRAPACVRACVRVCVCVCVCVRACVRACVYIYGRVCGCFLGVYMTLSCLQYIFDCSANPHTSGVIEIVLVNCMYVVHFLYGQPFSKPKVTL